MLWIFDLDGTLVDSLPTITGHVNKVLKAYGYKQIPEEKIKEFLGLGARNLLDRVRDYAEIADKDLGSILENYIRSYNSQPVDGTVIFPDVESVLKN